MKAEWKIVTSEGSDSGVIELQKGENHIHSDVKGILSSCTMELSLKCSSSEKIFMNGYQTWTTCPEYTPSSSIRGLHGIPKAGINYFSFDRYGDYHFIDYPNQKGQLHGFSYMYLRQGEYYRLFASLDEEPGYTVFRYDANQGKLTISRDAEGLHVNGYNAFDLYYAEGSEETVFDGWFAALKITPRTNQKLYGYSSWYNRYQDISSESIMNDLDGSSAILQKGDLFQIDDGWEPHIGDWLEADPVKFPEGMKKAADTIHERGLKAGIWLAPFAAEKDSDLYRDHQDWFYKVNGEPWRCGCNWSGFYALDIDNPDVQFYLRKVFDRVLNDWGYDLVKLDFLYTAACFGNDRETRAGRMIRAMKMLREFCGDKLILGCGVPVMPAFGIVDYCRISCDVTLDWNDKLYMQIIHRERPSTKNAIANIISRRHLNGRAYLSDPDVFFLREENTSLTPAQKEKLAVLDALLGGVFITSDDAGKYSEAAIWQYRRLRHLSEAEKAVLKPDNTIEYVLDGEESTIKI